MSITTRSVGGLRLAMDDTATMQSGIIGVQECKLSESDVGACAEHTKKNLDYWIDPLEQGTPKEGKLRSW